MVALMVAEQELAGLMVAETVLESLAALMAAGRAERLVG